MSWQDQLYCRRCDLYGHDDSDDVRCYTHPQRKRPTDPPVEQKTKPMEAAVPKKVTPIQEQIKKPMIPSTKRFFEAEVPKKEAPILFKKPKMTLAKRPMEAAVPPKTLPIQQLMKKRRATLTQQLDKLAKAEKVVNQVLQGRSKIYGILRTARDDSQQDIAGYFTSREYPERLIAESVSKDVDHSCEFDYDVIALAPKSLCLELMYELDDPSSWEWA